MLHSFWVSFYVQRQSSTHIDLVVSGFGCSHRRAREQILCTRAPDECIAVGVAHIPIKKNRKGVTTSKEANRVKRHFSVLSLLQDLGDITRFGRLYGEQEATLVVCDVEMPMEDGHDVDKTQVFK